MKDFGLAIQLYSLRDDMEKDFRGTLEKVKEMGYDGVEFAGLYDHTPDEVKQMCEEIGLTPVSAHVALAAMMKNPDIMKDYAKIGCKYIVIPFLDTEHRPGNPKFFDVIDNAAYLGKIAKKTGLQLCYHNHDFEFNRVNGMIALDYIYSHVDDDLLHTEFDVCWVSVGGGDPVEYIHNYADRTDIIHLKDYVGSKSENMYALLGDDETQKKKAGKFEFRPVGYGVQDMPAILKAAKEVGTEWVIVEQDNPDGDRTPLTCAKLSAEYLLSL